MGSKDNITTSFKSGTKITGSLGSDVSGASASFGWSNTTGDSLSKTLTKSETLEVKDPGNGDGLNHDQDMFELLLNPTVTLTMDVNKTIYWQPGWSDAAPVRYEVFVGELRNPATMRPQVAAVLQGLGFAAADYKAIRCLDPFAGPGSSGPGGQTPDYCHNPTITTNGATAVQIDPNRFRPTSWILPYEPPEHALDLCPSMTPTIKNDYVTENAKSTQDEYTASVQIQAGETGIWGLKIEQSMTWTVGATDTTTEDDTQSASLTLVCPSVNYTGPTLFQVYVDQFFGTFVFVPFDPATMQITQQGTVADANGKPALGEPVTLAYGGHTYHTFTSARGTYRFMHPKAVALPKAKKGTLTVHGQKKTVTLGSATASAIRIQ